MYAKIIGLLLLYICMYLLYSFTTLKFGGSSSSEIDCYIIVCLSG